MLSKGIRGGNVGETKGEPVELTQQTTWQSINDLKTTGEGIKKEKA